MIELSHLAYFFQRFHVRDLDLFAGKFQYAFRSKVGERADGIGGGHVREIGHVFPRETNFQGHVIILEPVRVFQHEQGFCQTSANMFLRERDRPAVRESEVGSQRPDHVHGNVRVTAHDTENKFCFHNADNGFLKSLR